MKKFFKNNDWREALPILYYLLRLYLLYEVINLIHQSDKSIFFQVIISILIVCLEFQWFVSQANKKE